MYEYICHWTIFVLALRLAPQQRARVRDATRVSLITKDSQPD